LWRPEDSGQTSKTKGERKAYKGVKRRGKTGWGERGRGVQTADTSSPSHRGCGRIAYEHRQAKGEGRGRDMNKTSRR